jgi:hypothetical protein
MATFASVEGFRFEETGIKTTNGMIQFRKILSRKIGPQKPCCRRM